MSVSTIVVEVTPRTETGKAPAGRLRRAGMVPAIVYGMGLDPYPVAVSPKRIDEVVRGDAGRNTIFTLRLEGSDQTRAAMIKELTRDPVSARILHVDLVRVDLTKSVTVRVPIRLVGTAAGVKEGGHVDFVHREVEVECLPANIPEHLDVDISALVIGDQIHVSDLAVPAGVKLLDDGHDLVMSVLAPAAAAATPAEGAAAEPAAGTTGTGAVS